MENSTPIILVRQLHKAKRAGDHYDLRVVIGDKAYSWATKKEMPELGKPHVIFEQPVHDRTYALSKKVVIPKGQYGAGVTTLDFAQKGKALVTADEYHLDLNNGERFLMKRLNPEKYGEKSWLFARKRTYKEKEELALKKNKYLEKIASTDQKKKSDGYSGWGRAGMVVGLPMATSMATMPAVTALGKHALKKETPDISESDVKSYIKAKKLRHVVRDNSSSLMGAHFQPAMSKNIYPRGGLRGMPKYRRPSVTANDPASALHEYGHAHSIRGGHKKLLGSKKTTALLGSNLVMKSGYAAMLGAYMGTSDNETARKASPYATAALAAPMLHEEAVASLSPYKHLHKTRGKKVANQFLKKMLPAFGTYGTLAAGSIGTAVLAKKLTENRIAKNRAAKKD